MLVGTKRIVLGLAQDGQCGWYHGNPFLPSHLGREV